MVAARREATREAGCSHQLLGSFMEEEDGASRHGGRSELGAAGGGVDLISALPEDLLLQILVRLRCSRAAARTSLLSRRWRALWTRLPDLIFHDIAFTSLQAALASLQTAAVAPGPAVVSLLDIRVPGVPLISPHQIRSPRFKAQVSSLLHAAARLSPAEIRFALVRQETARHHFVQVDMPRFHCATSIELRGLDLVSTDPRDSFPTLECLSLTGCRVDLTDFVLGCPRLRVLRVTSCLLGDDDIAIRSESLKELVLEGDDTLGVSILAPMLENVSLCRYSRVKFNSESNALGLWMDCADKYKLCFCRSLAREIEKSLATDYSVLDVHLPATGHPFGAVVLHLLRIHLIRYSKGLPSAYISEIYVATNIIPCAVLR